MENPGQKYLLNVANNNSNCLLSPDTNTHANDKTNPLTIQIQPNFPYGDGNFHSARPSDRNKNIIDSYTQVRVVENSLYWRTIFPEGGNTALIFRCDRHKPGAFLVGTPTCPREADYVISGGDYFCVFFYPCMGYAFYPLPATELTDRSLPLAEIMPRESEGIIERIILSDSFQDRISIFEKFMEKRLPFLTKIPDQIIYNISTIHRIAGLITDEKMTNCNIYTDRHIRRLFQKYIGISPKLYSNILRHQKTMRIINDNPYCDMDELALEAGYYDQPHFINQFKRFTGTTPSQYIKNLSNQKMKI